jgi:large subunit ribosomal protein L7Ae
MLTPRPPHANTPPPPRPKQAPKKKVAAAPLAVKKTIKKDTNPLYEKRAKTFGLGGVPPPKRDLHRFVKWPKYVRLQRQRRVLSMRLKVPPALNRFVTRHVDKSQAEALFKLLLKYRPEDKKEKKERLAAEAEARAKGGAPADKKKPLVVKYGLNHVTTLVETKKAQLVIIAHDVDPIELVVWLPQLCKRAGVPYCIVKGKARLGAIVHQKTAAALAVTGVKPEDQREFAKIVESVKAQFNDGARVNWGGGIMGVKSQHKQKAKERVLAKELAQRAGV